jgi:hypothetical protein
MFQSRPNFLIKYELRISEIFRVDLVEKVYSGVTAVSTFSQPYTDSGRCYELALLALPT